MVTFLDPGFHETKQEEFDGDIKDRLTEVDNLQGIYPLKDEWCLVAP